MHFPLPDDTRACLHRRLIGTLPTSQRLWNDVRVPEANSYRSPSPCRIE